jgi:hypothetical protein
MNGTDRRTVQRYPCGLVFNVLPYRHQPLCFWKEMLKNLMHSMSMNMIREKAVLNFLKRIQLVTPSSPSTEDEEGRDGGGGLGLGLVMQVPGWLELRKGFYTFLAPSGELIIFRDGVVTPAIDERDEEGEQKDAKPMEAPVAMAEVMAGLRIGPWKITAQEMRSRGPAQETPTPEREEEDVCGEDDVDEVIDFQSILNGQFCYSLEMPQVPPLSAGGSICSLSLLQQQGGGRGKASTKPLGCPALWNLDPKLRTGLPLLVPPSPAAAEGKGKKSSNGEPAEERRRYAIKYVFAPQSPLTGGS